MHYDLNEEQTMLQNMVRRLAREKVAPGASRRDEDGKFDWEMVELLRENGLYGIDFPEEFGGSEAGILAMAIVVENARPATNTASRQSPAARSSWARSRAARASYHGIASASPSRTPCVGA